MVRRLISEQVNQILPPATLPVTVGTAPHGKVTR